MSGRPTCGAPATGPLIEACDLAHHFDVSRPWLARVLEGQPRTPAQGRGRNQLRHPPRGDAGPGGRIGLRQVHGGPSAGRTLRPDPRGDPLRRHRARRPAGAGGDRRCPPAVPDDLPGSLRQPEPALAGEGHHRRADPRPPAGLGVVRCWRGWRPSSPGRPGARRRRQVPARVLGRPAPADLHRAGAVEQPGVPGCDEPTSAWTSRCRRRS